MGSDVTTSFNGWLNSWSGWGGATDANAMSGSAAFAISATGTLGVAITPAYMEGIGTFSITAIGTLTDVAATEQPTSYPTPPAVVGSHSYWGKPYKGTFLSPGAVPWVPPTQTGRRRKRRDLDILFLTR